MLIFENKIITKILFPLSWPYFVFVRIKNFFYDHKILKQYSLPCKVISVGNIMVGGSGKTPAVEFIAQWLKKHGKKVVILSRGYKRTSRGLLVVSDGKTLHTDVYSAGDEAYLLARKLKDVPVLVDKKRERAGLMACKTFTPDFILLDDGYQYRRLARNIDIVMFDNFEAIRNIRLLPAGLYREPCSSLNRAHLCWFSKLNDNYQAVPDNWSPFQLIRSKYIPVKISHFKNEMDEIDLKQLKNKKVFAFCGIANPKSFMRTLKDLNVQIYGYRFFPDHYKYSAKDIIEIIKLIKNEHRNLIFLTTEKDRVKILPLNLNKDLPIYYLVMKLELFKEDRHLLKQIFLNETP